MSGSTPAMSYAPEKAWLAWEDRDLRDALGAPGELTDWLTYGGLLTRYLRDSLGDEVQLRVLREGDVELRDHDAAFLNTDRRIARAREITLARGGDWLIYALTLIPTDTLQRHPWLSDLGNHSLGEALAEHGGFTRSDFGYRRLESGESICHCTPPASGHLRLWARRSRFQNEDVSLAVYEVFSPLLFERPAC